MKTWQHFFSFYLRRLHCVNTTFTCTVHGFYSATKFEHLTDERRSDDDDVLVLASLGNGVGVFDGSEREHVLQFVVLNKRTLARPEIP